jgi:hypothetical protein
MGARECTALLSEPGRQPYSLPPVGFSIVSHEDWHIQFGHFEWAARRRRLLRQVGLPMVAAVGAGGSE